MSDARFELLKAMRLAMLGDTGLAAMITGVSDPAPRGGAYPFVTFGDVRTTPQDGDQPPTLEHQVEVWVYSRAKGRWEVSQIADTVRALLDDAALSLSGHDLIDIRHRDTEVAPTRDRHGFRARLRFRAVTARST